MRATVLSLSAALFSFSIFSAPADVRNDAVTIEPVAVAATVTPGATTAWLAFDWARPDDDVNYITAFLVTDDDRDGVVRMPYPDGVALAGGWLIADLSSREIQAVKRSTGGLEPFAPRPFPERMFVRGPDGAYSHLFVPALAAPAQIVLARPGAGAWVFWGNDGSFLDRDQTLDGIVSFDTADMTPLEDSPAAPAGVEPGDLLMVLGGYAQSWFGGRVDDHLAETDGPGVFRLTAGGDDIRLSERAGSVVFTVTRIDGSDGAATVRYRTVEEGAIHGINFEERSGTLSFAAGEVIKSVEVPIIDDDLYAGDVRFRFELDAPSGATLHEQSAAVVTIRDTEQEPRLTLGDTMWVPEGDAGERSVWVPFSIAGPPRRDDTTLTWQWGEIGTGEAVVPRSVTQGLLELRYTSDLAVDGDDHGALFVSSNNTSSAQTWVVVQDDDVPRVIIDDVVVTEDAGRAAVTLRLAKPAGEPFTVTCEPWGETADYTDYLYESSRITFSTGQTTARCTFPILNDDLPEADETVTIEVESTIPLFERARGKVTITEEPDGPVSPPALSIDDIRVHESQGHADFLVRLSAPVPWTVSALFATTDGDATAAADYQQTTGAVSFAPGETVKRVVIAVANDATPESEEWFAVAIADAAGAAIVRSNAVGVIVDDDTVPARRRTVRH